MGLFSFLNSVFVCCLYVLSVCDLMLLFDVEVLSDFVSGNLLFVCVKSVSFIIVCCV